MNERDRPEDAEARGLRFLIVDDSDDQRYLVRRTLAALGAENVVEATSGRRALEMLDGGATIADIVVSDLQMPDMDGMELVRHLGARKLPLSVILLSALDNVLLESAATMTEAYGVKIIGAIEKPATKEKLSKVIDRYRPALAGPSPSGSGAAFTPSTTDVLAAISAEEFEPHFQPIVDLASGKVVGAEALARWRHPIHGVLGPEAFLPQIAAAGFMDELSWIMFAMTALEAGKWRRRGFRPIVSVNVSATSLADPGYAEAVTQIVSGHGLEPSELILELTETEAILNFAAVLENLTRLRMRGFGLAIDDYGVAYSSMKELSRMPFTEIKIDRSFVTGATTSETHRLMVEQVVAIADQLGVKTVAEGVETQAQRDLVHRLGCHMIQGYFVAGPMRGNEFLRWMLDYRATRQSDSQRPFDGALSGRNYAA
jgi:EAL domain-containing protein (putative c-di-GMP-specific phosphodiesterase class I)/FixJ family two-component response regulator